ncbi:MAG: hypothetical protein K2X03_00375 [Bryobacteraceae bacterium]|nr:hypothetical protein [Bryobacteraceae bacterium]
MRTLLCLLLAQSMYLPTQEPLPSRIERAPLEQPRRLPMDPDRVFAAFISPDAAERAKLAEALELDHVGDDTFGDVRQVAVNLDEQPDRERLLIAKGLRGGVAFVLKQRSDGWWCIGTFLSYAPNRSVVPDAWLETKETVFLGTQDIVLRDGGAFGSGIGQHNLAIYRVWQGKLYEVFNVIEHAYTLPIAPEDERAIVQLTDFGEILVDQTRTAAGRTKRLCTPYRWDVAQFSFVAQRPNGTRCPAKPGRQILSSPSQETGLARR